MTPLCVQDEGDHYTVHTPGMSVERCCIDYAFTIDIYDEGSIAVTLRIEGPFVFRGAGPSVDIAFEHDICAVSPALSVLHRGVDRLVAWKDGRADIYLAGDYQISVPPDERYEAWQAAISTGARLVSMPGGELAVFGAD